MKNVELKPIKLKNHPICHEMWLQDIIAGDPSILGLGDLILKDQERNHPGAGRLDLLLQEPDDYSRYECEIQLGASDESHIIRTIEYWDIERKRYPQYEHTAVIVAEDITSRFLNVISLFNGTMPMIALQLTAFELDGGVGLHFARILDTLPRGFVDEDEQENSPVDRSYWENSRGTTKTVNMADEVLALTNGFVSGAELSYNKHYIGCKVNGRAFNFFICRPQKSAMNLSICLPKSEEIDTRLEESDLTLLEYTKKRWKV